MIGIRPWDPWQGPMAGKVYHADAAGAASSSRTSQKGSIRLTMVKALKHPCSGPWIAKVLHLNAACMLFLQEGPERHPKQVINGP